MPYLPIDFDGREDTEKVAAVIGVHPGVVSWGLQEAWLRAFREHQAKRPDPDIVSEIVLLGCLGPAGAHTRCIEAMVEFRFLERVGEKYRLRGAAKWLFGLEGKRRGGLASRGNLIPGGRHRQPSPAESQPTPSLGSAETYAETPAETKPVGRTSALTASSQQPAAEDSKTTPSSSSSTGLAPGESSPVTGPNLTPEAQALLAERRKGGRRQEDLLPLPQEPASPGPTEQARRVFEHWQRVMGKPRAIFDEKRQRLLKARLAAGYSVEQLCAAIDGCAKSPWHRGENERRQVYDDIALICRDAEHVERFIGLAEQPPQPSPAQRKPSIEDRPCMIL